MARIQRFVFLSDKFYTEHPQSLFPEIEHKTTRPYIQVLTLIDGVQYAIPLRSNINHPHVFWTDKENHCGVDYSKAVVISDEEYIDADKKPFIRQNEFDALRGKDYRIQMGMRKYIARYMKAKQNPDDAMNSSILEKSTLQYYEAYFMH